MTAEHPFLNEWRALAGELEKRGWFDRPYTQHTGVHGEIGFGWGSASGGKCPLLLVQVVHDGFDVFRLKDSRHAHYASAAETVATLDEFAQECGFLNDRI